MICRKWLNAFLPFLRLLICGFGILVQNAELSLFKFENEYYDDSNYEDYGYTEENEKE